MKKIAFLVAAAGILFTFLAANSFAEDAALKVVAQNGKAFVQIYPSKEWTELTIGQVVHSKDIVKTDICDTHSKEAEPKFTDAEGHVCPACGVITLELPDKSTIALKPGTEISIDELVMDSAARKVKVNMPKGALRMIVSKVNTPSDFSVKTPNAIYGATGTVFYVKSSAAGTSVYVAEGSITAVNPADGKVYTIGAGMMITFNADGTVVGPVPASGIDISDWTSCYVEPGAEPYTPPGANRPNFTPPGHTRERPVSGG